MLDQALYASADGGLVFGSDLVPRIVFRTASDLHRTRNGVSCYNQCYRYLYTTSGGKYDGHCDVCFGKPLLSLVS